MVMVLHNGRVLTLGELLNQQSFGLRLLTGGDAAHERDVAGAHNSEMPKPSEFLPPSWVMLTLGMRLRGHATAQRALVAELDEAGLCALGFGVGVAFERVPRAVLDEANSRGFPVFEIPYDTPYREIVGFVNRSLLSTDFRLVQRSLSMQNYLMDALREEDPVAALVHRLGELLDSTILVFDAHGNLEAASRDAAFDTIWAQVVQDEQPSIQRALVDGSDTLSIPIDAIDRPRRWLVVASRGRSLPRQLALSVIQSTERLLELVALSQRAAAAEERVVRAELLTAALQPHDGYKALEMAARIRRYGIDFSTPPRILVLEPCAPSEATLDAARIALEHAFDLRRVPYLLAVRGQQLVSLVQAEPAELSAVVTGLVAAADHQFMAGGGRPIHELASASSSLNDAQMAVQEFVLHGSGGLRLFEDLGVAAWLVGVPPPSELRTKVDTVLGELLLEPDLYETLVVFLRHHARVAATARAMSLHENSLRYRLGRIEALLGCSLREVPTLVDLYLATLAVGAGQGATRAPGAAAGAR